MRYLSNIQNESDIATVKWIQDYVKENSGKINAISVDNVEQPISDDKRVNIDLTAKADKTDLELKVDGIINSTQGKALIFNESDGGGAKFEHIDGTESFVGVNNGGGTGLAAQIYADKLVDGRWQGAKLDITNNGMYYTVGNESVTERDIPDNELAVKGDIKALGDSFDLIKLDVAESGYIASYKLTKSGTQIGSTINIPKDFLVRSCEIKVVEEADVPYEGAVIGDKYIDFVINVKAGVTASEEHIYLPVNELVDVYTGSESITISNSNVISISNSYDTSVTNRISTSVESEARLRESADEDIIGRLNSKQETLVSGVNIKTINNESILGNGNISISGTGAVISVNGKDGVVQLTASDVGALSNTTIIPTKTSELTNDSGYLTEHQSLANYPTIAAMESAINVEKNRAQGAESAISTSLETEISRATGAEEALGQSISAKQDTITDLDTIRSGAEAGSTAVQPSAILDMATNASVDTKLTSYTNTDDMRTAIASAVNGKLNTSEKGAINGVAELDSSGKVPASQLPSYVDAIVEFPSRDDFPVEGESGKIYVATDTNVSYRWTGTVYVAISGSLALGETASTAYAGNKGKANAEAISAIQTSLTNDYFTSVQTSEAISVAVTDKITSTQAGTMISNALVDYPTTSIMENTVESHHDATKQDIINDLSTIRTGASAGATAVQRGDLASVATSGSYADLLNKPTIPTKTSELTNDSSYLTSVFIAGTSAPSNTKLLWIDTTPGASGLKYFNGSSWVLVPTFWA